MPHWLAWVVVLVVVFEGGFMAFDGARALTAGDYVTPKSGRFAGCRRAGRAAGPWRCWFCRAA